MTEHLGEFVIKHTIRGECKCGRCMDVGVAADPQHSHTINMVFFKVAPHDDLPTKEEFIRRTREHPGEFTACDPLDGKEHSYIELGAWIGDQGMAMQYMALGVMIGVFTLLTPHTMLKLPDGDRLAMQMAGMGYVSISRAA